MVSLLFAVFTMLTAHADSYKAERDPVSPAAKKQYRLFLRTPGRPCRDWRKVTPLLPKEDFLLSDSRKDEDGSCRFLWVITPDQTPGAIKFELEPFGSLIKETFELGAAAGYVAPAAAPQPKSGMPIGGVANENGTGPADTAVKGKIVLPGSGSGNFPQ